MKLTIFGRKKRGKLCTLQGEIDRKLEAALPDCRLVDISVATSGQRMVKSKEEIEVFVIIIIVTITIMLITVTITYIVT